MKDYSAMSDLEVNAQVSRELYGPVSRGHQMDLANGAVDYCNNPADAWPIIVENEIALISSWNEEGVWGATVAPWNSCEHTNPLRAAMIVFLQLNDAEKCDG